MNLHISGNYNETLQSGHNVVVCGATHESIYGHALIQFYETTRRTRRG